MWFNPEWRKKHSIPAFENHEMTKYQKDLDEDETIEHTIEDENIDSFYDDDIVDSDEQEERVDE